MIVQLALLASLQQQTRPAAPDNSYLLFVASEGFNQVALVRFGPAGARIEHRTLIRLPAIDSANPRTMRVAPGGQYYYVATALGFPTGELLKVRVAADSAIAGQPLDTLRGREPLEGTPGTIEITPDGDYALVTNATPADNRQPSWISVIYLRPMVEVARIPTCPNPRGGRLTADGARYYSLCLEDELVEIDVRAMKVSRRLALAGAGELPCAPSAVTTASDEAHVYVTCEQSGQVIEVDSRAWTVTRRIAVGKGPRDVAATPDGHTLVVTNQGSQSVSLIDLVGGRQITQVPTLLHIPSTVVISPGDPMALVTIGWAMGWLSVRRAPAAVAVSPDNRYAFVTVVGVGGDPGTVDVVDLAAGAVVATVEVGRGAGSIDFWKMEAKKSPR